MAVDKIVITAPDGFTDEEKNAMLAAANVNRNAAIITRDAAGKVSKVEVNLPDTASEVAEAKIKANNGKATANRIPDLTPGLGGIDGTQAQYDTFAALGSTTVTDDEVTIVDNEDGTLTFKQDSEYGNLDYQMQSTGTVLQSPNPVSSELKFKFDEAHANGEFQVTHKFQNDGYTLAMSMKNSGHLTVHLNGSIAYQTLTEGITDTDLHETKVEVVNGEAIAYLDSVEIVRANLSLLNNSFQWANFSLDGWNTNQAGVTVDYWRFTETV